MPLVRLSDGFYATLELGGGRSGLFLVDTGSHDNFATTKGERLLRAAGASDDPEGTLTSGPVSVGGAALRPIRFLPWGDNQDAMAPAADGILGLAFLSRFLLGLDLAHRTMRLWPADLLSVDAPKRWLEARADGGMKRYGMVPLRPHRGLLWATVLLDGKTIDVVPDTGAGETYLSAATARRLGWTTWTGGHGSHLYDGPVHLRHHFVHELQIGRVRYVGAHEVSVMDGVRDVQFVGTDVLLGTVLVLDARRSTLVVAPARGLR